MIVTIMGVDMEITPAEGVREKDVCHALCEMILALVYANKHCKEKNMPITAGLYTESAMNIFSAIDKTGYFELYK